MSSLWELRCQKATHKLYNRKTNIKPQVCTNWDTPKSTTKPKTKSPKTKSPKSKSKLKRKRKQNQTQIFTKTKDQNQ